MSTAAAATQSTTQGTTPPPNGAAGSQKPAAASGADATLEQGLRWEQQQAATKGTEGAKGGEQNKPAEGEQKPVELKWHDGMRVAEEVRGKFSEFAKANKLTLEQQQGLIDFVRDTQAADDAALAKLDAEQTAKENAERAALGKQLREHPEFGGAKFDESFAIARRAAKQFGGDELVKLLNSDFRFGNSPVVFAALVRIGQQLGEDAIGGDRPSGAAHKSASEQLAEKMFTAPTTEKGA